MSSFPYELLQQLVRVVIEVGINLLNGLSFHLVSMTVSTTALCAEGDYTISIPK